MNNPDGSPADNEDLWLECYGQAKDLVRLSKLKMSEAARQQLYVDQLLDMADRLYDRIKTKTAKDQEERRKRGLAVVQMK